MTEIRSRHDAARLEFDIQLRRFEDVRACLEATFADVRTSKPGRERLRDSAYARLQARLETMPVIEQAKGILMAQYRCQPDEAFELLRRASQRANIKVSDLAVQIVEQITSPEPQSAVRPPRPSSNGGRKRTRTAELALRCRPPGKFSCPGEYLRIGREGAGDAGRPVGVLCPYNVRSMAGQAPG
jgi:hypothetical protein